MRSPTLSYPFRNLDQPTHKRWYEMKAALGQADIYITDEIGLFGVPAKDFTQELLALDVEQIVVHLNSPGGDVFDGVAIYRALKDHKAQITTRVDSIAASIASVIAMAGDRVVMTKRSMMMIHDPYAMAVGTSEDMRKAATALEKMADTIAGIYSDRAGGSVADWRARMAEESWYSDEEAVEAGLADEVVKERAAKNAFDLSMFRHPPEAIASVSEPDEPSEDQSRDWHEALLRIAAAELEVAR